ncbi:MAG: hypothetical protein ACI9UV_000792 [Algoriphagus sp.]|jgi:hypothetical protein
MRCGINVVNGIKHIRVRKFLERSNYCEAVFSDLSIDEISDYSQIFPHV